MPQLIAPDVRVHASFLDAMKEFVEEGADERSLLAHEMQRYAATWHRPDVFAGYVDRLNAEPLEETPRIEGWVPNTTLWYVEGDTFLGRLAIRHRLNPFLRELGGHIGYAVRPTARRQGHATAMLTGALPVARRIGIDSVLVTCDTTNTASRKVIEAVGGVLEDQRGGKLRFWIRTDRIRTGV
jgi:predicted acetyltransferase